MLGLISRFIFLGVFTVFFVLVVALPGAELVSRASAFFAHIYSYVEIYRYSIVEALGIVPFLTEFTYIFNFLGYLIAVFLFASVALFIFGLINGGSPNDLIKGKQ